jgi:hypothetical protein
LDQQTNTGPPSAARLYFAAQKSAADALIEDGNRSLLPKLATNPFVTGSMSDALAIVAGSAAALQAAIATLAAADAGSLTATSSGRYQ